MDADHPHAPVPVVAAAPRIRQVEVVAALLVGTLAVSCGDDDSSATNTAAPRATSLSPTTTAAATTTGAPPPPTVATTTTTTLAPPTTTGAPTTSSRPATTEQTALAPEDIASSFFDAWTAGVENGVGRFADAAVAEFLTRQGQSRAAWDGPTCEGAAGSTYCSWSSPDRTAVLRVANEESKVVEVRLGPPPGGVALWPFTTAEEAVNTQQSVDEGHSPWQLEPDAVAVSYAENILGFDEPEVEHPTSDLRTVRITDAGGIVVDLTLAQVERTGTGGIWAIVTVQAQRAGS